MNDEVLAELRAIRELLTQMRDHQNEEAVCPHGATGLCMYCVLPLFDQMALDVREAVRRR